MLLLLLAEGSGDEKLHFSAIGGEGASLLAQRVKSLPAMQETQV